MNLLAAAAASTEPSASALVWSAFISSSVFGALIAATVTAYLAHRKSREEQLDRVRIMLAQGFQAVSEYKEFPYAIRRRRHDAPSEERVRLSDELRTVQARLTFYIEWTRIEDAEVGAAYSELVRNLRRVAGTACNEAWATPAVMTDDQMNIPRGKINLEELAAYERKYAEAVQAYIKRRSKWWHRG